MECLHIQEPDDSAWGDNQYLCWSKNLPDPGYRFQWHYSYFRNFMDYVYAKVHCIKWDIGSYKPWSSWKDNYLCQPYVNYGKGISVIHLFCFDIINKKHELAWGAHKAIPNFFFFTPS